MRPALKAWGVYFAAVLLGFAPVPPVSVADWTAANLSDKIEQIRDDYLDLLADWPVTLDGRSGAAP